MIIPTPRPRSLPEIQRIQSRGHEEKKTKSPKLSFGIDEILGNKRSKSSDVDCKSSTSSFRPKEMITPVALPEEETLANSMMESFSSVYGRLYQQYIMSGLGQKNLEMLSEYYRLGGFVPEETYKKYLIAQQLYHNQTTIGKMFIPKPNEKENERFLQVHSPQNESVDKHSPFMPTGK